MGTRRMLSAILFGRKKEKQKILGLILHRTATNRNPPGKCSHMLTRKQSHINKKGWKRIKMPEQRKAVALLPQSNQDKSTEEHEIKENMTKRHCWGRWSPSSGCKRNCCGGKLYSGWKNWDHWDTQNSQAWLICLSHAKSKWNPRLLQGIRWHQNTLYSVQHSDGGLLL